MGENREFINPYGILRHITTKSDYNDDQESPLKIPGPLQNHLAAITKTATDTTVAGTYNDSPCGGYRKATEERKKN